MSQINQIRHLEKLRKDRGIESGAARLWREVLTLDEKIHYMNSSKVFKRESEIDNFDRFTPSEQERISSEIASLQPWQLVFAAHVASKESRVA